MRIFYTGSDIEDLAARGVRQLEVGPGVALTDAARERAEELGVLLVTPRLSTTEDSVAAAKTASAAQPSTPSIAAPVATLPNRPRGCQHPPLAASANVSSPRRTNSDGGAMVDQLIQAVSALKKQGG